MQMAAHLPQKRIAFAEQAQFVGGQNFQLYQLFKRIDLITIARDPEQCVEVAQTPFAFLDIRLDQIARLTSADMALVALGQFRLDKLTRCAAHDLFLKACDKLFVQGRRARQKPVFEHGRPHCEIGLRLGHAIFNRARGMADLQAEIPEKIENMLDKTFRRCVALIGQQKQQVDV